MKLAVMQPYLFPYLGYFQLLAATDKFVVYDDVAFIKQGWINRNNILVAGRPYRFAVPLRDATSFRHINDTEIDGHSYGGWLRKLLMTIDQNYRRAPCYPPVRQLVATVFEDAASSIGALALRSVRETARYLELPTAIIDTSSGYRNNGLRGTARVIDICNKERAGSYINLIGGLELYAAEDFSAHGITLQFIRSKPITYRQFGETFTPALSIIDVMMFNEPASVRRLLQEFEFVQQGG